MESRVSKGYTKKRKLQKFGIIMTAILIVSLVPMWAFGSDSKNISDLVSVNNVEVQIYAPKSSANDYEREWQTYISNGVIADKFADYKLTGGESVRIKTFWKISQENMSQVIKEDGNYFEIDLPTNVFSFLNTVETNVNCKIPDTDNPGETKDVVIGKVQIKDNDKFLVTLNETGANAIELNNGWLLADCSVRKDIDGNKTIVIGDKTLPLVSIEKKVETPNTFTLWGKTNPGPIFKDGWQSNDQRTAQWRMEINAEDFDNQLKGEAITEKQNVIVEDYLPAYARYREDGAARFYMNYRYAMEDGSIAMNTFISEAIDGFFTPIPISAEQMKSMSAEEFKAEVEKADPFTYGIWQDKYFVLNLGDLPSSTKNMPFTKTKVMEKIEEARAAGKGSEEEIANTIAAYNRLYGNNETVPFISFSLELNTRYNGNEGDFVNEAKISWANNEPAKSKYSLEFRALSGGADMGLPGSVTIKKTDGDTGNALNGVKFSLEKQDQSGNYQPYKARGEEQIKATSDGAVVFAGLDWGKYRVIEEEGLDGYTDEIVFYDNFGQKTDGTFEITGDETESIFVNVKNFKEQIEEPTPPAIETTPPAIDTTPGAVAGEESTPEAIIIGGKVLGEEETPSDTNRGGNVLGEEAKTADIMNVVPLLFIICLVTLVLLVAARQASSRKQ